MERVIIIETILLNLINSLIQGSGEIINNLLMGLTEKVFYCEQAFSQVLGSSSLMDFNKVYNLFFDFAVSLIILKFVKKGFDIYIGWYEGDKDSDPANLAINFIRAIATAISFRGLYGVLVKIVTDFMDNSLLALLTLDKSQSLLDAVLIHVSHSLFWGISALVIIICYCILWVKFHVLGIEMFILRLGFPIACTGLIDSDKGMVCTVYEETAYYMCHSRYTDIPSKAFPDSYRLRAFNMGNVILLCGTKSA